jgi:hypothetical protein
MHPLRSVHKRLVEPDEIAPAIVDQSVGAVLNHGDWSPWHGFISFSFPFVVDG